MRDRLNHLERQHEFYASLDRRLRDVEAGVITNRRAVIAIYHSRIWKILCRAGALLLRLTGRHATPHTRPEIADQQSGPPDYGVWITRHEPAAEDLERMRRDADRLTVRPRIGIVTPERSPRVLASLARQTYPEWDLGVEKAEYVAFLDRDGEMAAFALWEVVQAIAADPDADLFYSDEDAIDEQGGRRDPFFKPGWSPDLLLSCNYVGPFVVMKRWLADGVSDAPGYECLLRASERTQRIRRIPKVLYHRRAAESTAGASETCRRALEAYVERHTQGARVEQVGTCRYRVRYPVVGEPRVSILIPTASYENVRRAVEGVLEKTEYPHYEIVLLDNSGEGRIAEYARQLAGRHAPVRHFDCRGQPFNFARMNNEAARQEASPYLLFLNDDTSVITPEWLTAMLEHAQRPEVGAVGAQLWYPNDLIQHAGVVMGIYGNCSHAFRGLPGGRPQYFDFSNLVRNCSAVTGACLMVAREKFLAAGAFDDAHLAVAFQDVDLCLKLLELGYRNVYTPYARLYHYESASKTEKDKIPDAAEDAFMKKKWAKYIADDPYYNPNLTRQKEDFSLAVT